MSSPSVGKNSSVIKELEKYVKHMFFKTAQIIIQSRQGGKSFTESQPNPKCQSWFSLAINDNSEITHEAKKVVSSAQVAGQGILAVPMCIEISLKTTEGDLLGTIHILCKHFYSTKLNLTSKFFTKTGVFRQNKRISFSTLHFDEIFML